MPDRIHSIDAMRIIAMVFVVLIHTDPFQDVNAIGNMINFGIKTISRFAVPFFFITSGYFFALKSSDHDLTAYIINRASKIGSFYIFGLMLTVPVFFAGELIQAKLSDQSIQMATVSSGIEYINPIELVYYGTSVSEILWFLPALFFSLFFISVLIRTSHPRYVLPVAVCFHIVGLLGATMLVDFPFETRDALFFGFFYTSIGYSISAQGWEPSKEKSRLLFSLICIFVIFQFIEFYIFGYPVRGEPFGAYVYAQSYGISTALLSTTLFLFLLSRPKLFADTPLPAWGTYAVGIYITHPTVFAILRGFRDTVESMGYAVDSTIVWHLILTPATIMGALSVYLLAHKLRIIKIGGSHFPKKPRL